MDWMFNEHKRSDPSFSVRSNLSSCYPTSSVGDKSSENAEAESTVSHPNNPELVEEPVEETCNELGPPAVSESEDSTNIDAGNQQTSDVTLSDEKPNEHFGNSNHIQLHKSDINDDPNSINSKVVSYEDSKSYENVSHDDKDEIIKSLREEVITDNFSFFPIRISYLYSYQSFVFQIDLLKAKIEEFEAECADGGIECHFKMVLYHCSVYTCSILKFYSYI